MEKGVFKSKRKYRSPFQVKIGNFILSKVIETSILALILIYACIVFVNLIFEDDLKSSNAYDVILAIEIFILVIFMIEISLKIFAFRVQFLKDGWNIFDILIVISCFILAVIELSIPHLQGSTFMRFRSILRLLRIVVMFRKVDEMRNISQKTWRGRFNVSAPVERVLEFLEDTKQLKWVSSNRELKEDIM